MSIKTIMCDLKLLHAIFISNTFTSNARLKVTKNQAKAQQHPEAELFLFENYSLSSRKLSSKSLRHRSHFTAPLTRTVFHGTESVSFLCPQIWDFVPDNLKSFCVVRGF